MNLSFEIQALTPIFSYGADQNIPEIRAASVRGQLRWWMNELGHPSFTPRIFGTSAGDDGSASKVIIRISEIIGSESESRKNAHKNWRPEPCYPKNTRFKMSVIERLGGLNHECQAILENAIQAWLLLGALGSRGTRGAGSLQEIGNALTQSQWSKRCLSLLEQSKAHLRLGMTAFKSEIECRQMICNTLGPEAFDQRESPLGYAKKQQRKTSPLRMRVVRFADADPARPYRIAALWTEANVDPLEKAIRTLQKGNPRGDGPKPIGDELANAIIIK